ncbi:MAG: hypothetical protein WCX83_00450 [Candidatus Cloacimonas sp.]|nr:hypothetical protein [Candidatus Cloacimonadota bacterium]
MSLKIAEEKVRCGKCKVNRAQRYCPRIGKDVCWECCVEMKVDLKCPAECVYLLRSNFAEIEKGTSTKVDSYREHSILTQKLIDVWAVMPFVGLDNQIPLEMAKDEEGREQLREYLNLIVQSPLVPAEYLSKKFNLALKYEKEEVRHYEEVAEEYLDLLIAQDWEKSVEYHSNSEGYLDLLYLNNYKRRRKENPVIDKLKSYQLLMSAVSENQEEALVYFEVNGKYDLTVILSAKPEKWRVQEIVLGSPNHFNGAGNAIRVASKLVAERRVEEAKEALDNYGKILIDSPDYHYLQGLYFLMLHNFPLAEKFYLNAVEIDQDFPEYKYSLAIAYHMNRNTVPAKRFYEETLDLRPNDTNALNNLAVIYEMEGDMEMTVKLLEKCLSIDPNSEKAKKNLERIKQK